jgi:NADPH-dependent curcumin reductase CurA
MKTTKTINLKHRPKGKPELTDFDFTTSEIPELNGSLRISVKTRMVF